MSHSQSTPDLPPERVGWLAADAVQMTLAEISLAHAIHVDRVVEMVWEGVIDPLGHTRDDWRFTALHLRQIGVAVRLQRDLGVNLPGVALALQLLREIEVLRQAAQ
jgi:chaperone modulatory protein CbpM